MWHFTAPGRDRHEEALALDEKTLQTRRRVLGLENPDTLGTASNPAIWLADMGRVEEAVVLAEETLAARRRVLGEGHPDTQTTARWLESLGEEPERPGPGRDPVVTPPPGPPMPGMDAGERGAGQGPLVIGWLVTYSGTVRGHG
ncbi:tetratricopeptide repeat protein [Streptomyces sp. NBC_00490]|uniref:tetratricopeptide repeat protein n=1 Tax=Streptomyces sp. NBC_00490 TaxID=2903657 RepID=UPI003FCCC431